MCRLVLASFVLLQFFGALALEKTASNPQIPEKTMSLAGELSTHASFSNPSESQTHQREHISSGVKAPKPQMDTKITQLLDMVYTGDRAGHRPKYCKPIQGGSRIHACSNEDNPNFVRISSINLEPLPMTAPGEMAITVIARLSKTIVPGSTMYVDSFSGTELLFSGPLDLCEKLNTLHLECPFKAFDFFDQIDQTLYIPAHAPLGNYSFVVRAYSPKGDQYWHLAATDMEIVPEQEQEPVEAFEKEEL